MVTEKQWEKQKALERLGADMGKKKYQDKLLAIREGHGSVLDTTPGMRILNEATLRVAHGLREFLDDPQNRRRTHAVKYFRKMLEDHPNVKLTEIAFIAVRRVISIIEGLGANFGSGLPTATVTRNIFEDINSHIMYKALKAKVSNRYVEKIKESKKTTKNRWRIAKVFRHLSEVHGIEPLDLPDRAQVTFGLKLLELVLEYGGFAQKKLVYSGRHKSHIMLEMLPEVDEQLTAAHKYLMENDIKRMPMVIPPADWDGMRGGGYLFSAHTGKVRFVTGRHKRDSLNLTELKSANEAVNFLQEVPYRINKEVLEVLETLWAAGGGEAGLPSSRDELDRLPSKYSSEDFLWLCKHDPQTIASYKNGLAEQYAVHAQEKSRAHSVRHCLMVAKKQKDEEAIYFPHVIDFRGRIYPSTEMLHPQGTDVAKGLLEFAEGLPLGERGAYWLKVDLANLFGEDKVSNDDRAKWTEANEVKILDTARDPLGFKWWHDADSPFKFLAGCMEYAGYKEEGINYISHHPVAQDGSCNGLQHFSAMSRDPKGCVNTNLAPLDSPSDTYSIILEKLRDKLRGCKKQFSDMWLRIVDRPLIKRPAMTTPYGVTGFGVAKQIMDHITKERAKDQHIYKTGISDKKEFTDAAKQLAKQTIGAIGDTVEASQSIKKWLISIAEAYAAVNKPVHWITPMGLHVTQQYYKEKKVPIDTSFCKHRIQVTFNVEQPEIDAKKQMQSISPNFVHSLDASHLMMTLLKCKKQGLKSISTVHDSFSCHPSNVDTMGKILRETLVSLYTDFDPLQELYDQALAELPESISTLLVPPPEKGTFDLELIKEAIYAFS